MSSNQLGRAGQDPNNVEMEDSGTNQNYLQPNEFLGGQSNQPSGMNQGGDKRDFSNDNQQYTGPAPDQDMMLRGGPPMG